MIVEDKEEKCPIISIEEGKICPMTVADKYNNDRHNSRRTTGSTCFTSFPDDCFFGQPPSVVMPPHPPGWNSLPIVGHLPTFRKYCEAGEPAPAMIKAFNMCDGDMMSLDIPGLSEKGLYFTDNAEYAGIVSTDLEHWGKITHKDRRGPFHMARQVIGDSLFVASDTEVSFSLSSFLFLTP